MQRYKSTYTGPQMDVAFERALPGGAIDQTRPSRNLLGNWDFRNPVNQRGGYVVPPNTLYFTTRGDASTAAYTDGKYYKATQSVYADEMQFTYNGATVYTLKEKCVRGYTGAGYGIDRWYEHSGVLRIQNDIIELSGASSGGMFEQKIENPRRFAGNTVTLSVLGKRSKASWYIAVRQDGAYKETLLMVPNDFSCTSITFAVDSTLSNELAIVFACWDEVDVAEIKAIKLELGAQQTLAHQDENGNWVLNEIPNYADTLARCQRYFQTFATESLRPTDALDFRPVMRANPALSTITVGGKTLYTASADL